MFKVHTWDEIQRRLAKVINADVLHLLRHYQKAGVAFFESREGRALLGDEMGLGKTLQALAWSALRPKLRPIVIVCPAGTKLGWEVEIHKWMENPGKVHILYGQKGQLLQPVDILIVNYEILSNKYTGPKKKRKQHAFTGWVDYIRALNPQIVIIDEVQRIKNKDTLQAKAVRRLCRNVKHIIGLSGTPIENNPIEFWNIITLLSPFLFDYWHYIKHYCGAKWNGFGYSFTKATHKLELHEKMKPIMLRRLKSEVAKDLPPKIRQVVPLALTNRKDYVRELNGFGAWLERARPGGLDAVEHKATKLRHILWEGKKEQCFKWTDDFISSGEKLVGFAWHKKILNELHTKYKKSSVRIDGSVTGPARAAAIKRFQEDDNIRIIFCNWKVVLGMNGFQTASSNSAWFELPWCVGDIDQADDRLHRLGTTADTINCRYLVGVNTLEEEIAALLDKKRTMISAVVDGQEVGQDILFLELIKKLSEQAA